MQRRGVLGMALIRKTAMTSVKNWLAAVAVALMAMVGSVHAAETVTYYYTSPQGTVLATADAAGNVLSMADYRPYGVQVLGTPEAGPGYTGHVNDPESGLVYMQARYYESSSGRFLSIDPAGYVIGDAFSSNRYAYAKNNPIKNIDPDGRTVTCGASSCVIDSHSLLELVVDYATVGAIYTERLVHNAVNPSPAGPMLQDQADEGSREAPIISDRPIGSDGKQGSTGGVGTGKRFKPESDAVKEGKEGIPCVYCGVATTNTRGKPNSRERDHIDPKSRGGNNTPENERDSCRTCNRQKGSRNPDEWQPQPAAD